MNTIENNILIVDDEPLNLEILEFSLEALSKTKIIRASDGVEALFFIERIAIDLIILDVNMPVMDGLELLEKLKKDEKLKYIPVIMVTAEDEERHRALELGSEDFLLKPIDVIELRFKVNNLLKLKKFNDLQQFFNHRLEEEIAKKEKQLLRLARVEEELKWAKEIQERLIPKKFPTNNGLEIHGRCIQASEVGGDYFDVFPSVCGNYTIMIMADVSGHGLASALLAMQFRSLVRAELNWATGCFAKRINSINTIFSDDNEESSMFVTAVFLRYHHKTRVMESVNAGHFNPLGYPPMEHTSGIPLGIQSGFEYELLITPFPKGSSILLYTDGIVEGENEKDVMYQAKFLKYYEEIKELSPQKQNEKILKAYYDFVVEQKDDVTLLAIKSV